MNVVDFLKGLGVGVATNNPVSMLVNTGADVVDLGIAGAGYLGHKAGLLSAGQLPEPLNRSKLPLSNEWMRGMLGVNDNMASTGGELVGSFVNPGSAAKGIIQKAKVLYPDYASRKKLADSMLQKGSSKEEVWKKTGMYKAPTGEYFGEVSDVGTSLKGLNKVKANKLYTLGEVADLPAIEHLPDNVKSALKSSIKVRFVDEAGAQKHLGDATASWNPSTRVITVRRDDPNVLSNFLHEFQHGASSLLGGYRGGSPAEFAELAFENQGKIYKEMLEAEWAKNVLPKKGVEQELEIEHFFTKYPKEIMNVNEIEKGAKKMDFLTSGELSDMIREKQMFLNRAKAHTKTVGAQTAGGMAPDLDKGMYANLADEAFARAVQARRGKNQAEIFESPFWERLQMDWIGEASIRDPDLLSYQKDPMAVALPGF